jgi:ATP-dependent Clp protease ATP-binding subunit ClpA
VIDEVQASPKPIILFIDETHTLVGAGGAAGTGDAANLLKPALARGTCAPSAPPPGPSTRSTSRRTRR